VRRVRIEPTLDEAVLKRSVNACERAGKPVFLWGTAARKQKSKPSQLNWYIQRVMDVIAALVLLFLPSPIMLAIGFLAKSDRLNKENHTKRLIVP
jgi:lipopolysaccharide/colanic/teichoic acid biosynthesis glycosyltransferase